MQIYFSSKIKEIFSSNLYCFWNDINFDEKWDFACSQSYKLPFHLTLNSVYYQYEYLQSVFEHVCNTSIVLKLHDCFLIWPMFFVRNGTDTRLLGSGYKMSFHTMRKLSKQNQKKLKEEIINLINFLKDNNVQADIVMPISDIENSYEPISATLLNSAKHFSISRELVIDLKEPEQKIWLSFRKSYRPLVNKGIKILSSTILNADNINRELWLKFKNFHAEQAKRKTRSDKSWDIQYDRIVSGNAFLIMLYNNQELAGSAFFEHSEYECNYSVGVYDRNSTHLPIGHVAQYIAIKYLLGKGFEKYRIGVEEYDPHTQIKSMKIKSIEEFKAGFTKTKLALIVATV